MISFQKLNKLITSPHIKKLTLHYYSNSDKVGNTFFNPEIQKILRKITNVELEKVFRNRKLGEKLEEPEYKFMTLEELEDSKKNAEQRAEKYLQMPPFIDVREEINEVLSDDKELDGHDPHNSTFFFTDITFGIKNNDRIITVREPNGTLRKAKWDEREKMNQIYFPVPGRKLTTPKMFSAEYLEDLFARQEYLFILDRACLQFEPDDPEYHRVTYATYDQINKEKHFDVLRSTRHFGPLAFYLVFNKKIDNLLLENIQTERIDDAISVVHLYHIIHPDAKSAKETPDYSGIGVLKAFIEFDSNNSSYLELALQTYLELQKQRKIVEEGIKQAHGN